ncbi:50S ribosomal protein L6 [Candidatus Kuenenbacteria bacterium CG_4_9_14_3_um_filter_39_14]|uniref:Large ribosomal subunit protein uL6 n=6 Tax=Candidatus Kueneniibacteriota TaxID=1752740 RepID=A0A2M7MH75_9BACT|nr:50S ribosomal protein L6 [Candidatus Kuenenbacteria bacterium]OIP56761.1 MAG: 50S ribosomal protein L6 [Candidatus Kuenenbacteria bacterium CG2_30_39_24]PIP75306.1 MAG: 50S ribosomal protein L6 [Candidatus Kuenenbacteria bacterium CG22_combo_CG10-13_8_21_14_all_39_9]PIR81092.1 MAG: 50S ribosomal protein L6 [Candidatus Kuenenbacteria bacterium CG10_big_fil_rev_8_21_14_0_10_39_14]PIX92377.1 MAG: 50S ribosomal protein L6 [Candidatus Kuenenbacteria bacterium CG_4_10_14_3_um_filter_39_14]PJA9209
MSRIGKKPIDLPSAVAVNLNGQVVHAQGPKGELEYVVHPHVKIEQKENKLELTIENIDNKYDKALWGTNRQMVANIITGVSQGYTKQLEINGVGYKAELKGDTLVLAVGYSHPVNYKLPPSVTASVEKNIITLKSINKQLLGETAASLRKIRKPEPYKGKGIKYIDEIILCKAGKQVKTTGG